MQRAQSSAAAGRVIIQKCSRSRWRSVPYGPRDGERSSAVDERGKPFPARLSLTWLRNALAAAKCNFTSTFLPEGYPATVHRYYLPFSAWNMLQVVMGSAASVLSTQSLLYGLGLSSGSGTILLSSTLNWILKDGLGQLGSVAVVSWLGTRFDVDTRRLRFLGAGLLTVSCWLEVLVPLVPHYFILTAAIANTLKNISWMTTSATRAPILRHQGEGRDNLGDLTGKTASQTTLGATIGTGLGVLLSTAFLTSFESNSGAPLECALRCLLIMAPLSIISIFAAYQSCLLAVSPRLSVGRLEIIYYQCFSELFASRTSLQPRTEILSTLHRYIMVPETMCMREPLITSNYAHLTGPMSSVRLLIEPPLTDAQACSLEASHSYWIRLESTPSSTISLWFSADNKSSNGHVVFKALLEALIYKYFLGMGRSITQEQARELTEALEEPLRKALQHRGWIVDDEQLYLGPRHPLKFLA